MNNNEFATYVASINARQVEGNPRLARAAAMIIAAVPTTIRRERDGKVVTTPSVSFTLDNGETVIAPITTVGRATGANLGDSDLRLLRRGELHYFVANAVEGEQFSFRPNARSVEAATTNLLYTIHGIFPHERYEDRLDELPEYHIDIDTTGEADDDSGEDGAKDEPKGETLATKVANATSIGELKPLLEDDAFSDIDEEVARMRSLDKMQQAMLAHIA